eukprot:XP_008653907.1 putative carbonic anhydrase 2 [Zea mays]
MGKGKRGRGSPRHAGDKRKRDPSPPSEDFEVWTYIRSVERTGLEGSDESEVSSDEEDSFGSSEERSGDDSDGEGGDGGGDSDDGGGDSDDGDDGRGDNDGGRGGEGDDCGNDGGGGKDGSGGGKFTHMPNVADVFRGNRRAMSDVAGVLENIQPLKDRAYPTYLYICVNDSTRVTNRKFPIEDLMSRLDLILRGRVSNAGAPVAYSAWNLPPLRPFSEFVSNPPVVTVV